MIDQNEEKSIVKKVVRRLQRPNGLELSDVNNVVSYHIHNGIDSPKINYKDISGTPVALFSPQSNNLEFLDSEDWQFDGIFSPTSNTKVSWTGGNLIFADGSTFAITAGNTGTMSAITFIYFDKSVSQTTFQLASVVDFGGSSVGNSGHSIAVSPNGLFEYTVGQNGIVKFNTLLGTVATNGAIIAISKRISVSPDNSFLYLATGTTVYKINTSDLSIALSATIAVDDLIVSPDGLFLYGVRNSADLLYKIQTSDLTQPVSAAGTFSGPNDVGVSPDGLTVYVVNTGGANGKIQKFTASNLTGGTATNTSQNAQALAVSPDGTSIYVANNSTAVDKFNAALALATSVNLGDSQLSSIVVSIDNSFVFVNSQSGNKIYKLNASDLSTVTKVAAEFQGSHIMVSIDGSYVYLVNTDSTIQKLNVSDLSRGVFLASAIVGPNRKIIAVAQNVATTKNAIFDIFGGIALGNTEKLITSADIALSATGRSTAQTAAVTSVATYTVGSADGSFDVSANVNVTTSTTHNFTVTCAYTDETNTSRTLTMSFVLVAGTYVSAIINTDATHVYMGIPQRIRCKTATTITIATTGTFTTVTYNVEGTINQIT